MPLLHVVDSSHLLCPLFPVSQIMADLYKAQKDIKESGSPHFTLAKLGGKLNEEENEYIGRDESSQEGKKQTKHIRLHVLPICHVISKGFQRLRMKTRNIK